jgi:hypothetical protein
MQPDHGSLWRYLPHARLQLSGFTRDSPSPKTRASATRALLGADRKPGQRYLHISRRQRGEGIESEGR